MYLLNYISIYIGVENNFVSVLYGKYPSCTWLLANISLLVINIIWESKIVLDRKITIIFFIFFHQFSIQIEKMRFWGSKFQICLRDEECYHCFHDIGTDCPLAKHTVDKNHNFNTDYYKISSKKTQEQIQNQ